MHHCATNASHHPPLHPPGPPGAAELDRRRLHPRALAIRHRRHARAVCLGRAFLPQPLVRRRRGQHGAGGEAACAGRWARRPRGARRNLFPRFPTGFLLSPTPSLLLQVAVGMPPVQKAVLALLPSLAPTHLPKVRVGLGHTPPCPRFAPCPPVCRLHHTPALLPPPLRRPVLLLTCCLPSRRRRGRSSTPTTCP